MLHANLTEISKAYSPYFSITVRRGRHGQCLHVVSSEQSILRDAGDTGITRSGPLSEMSALPSQHCSCRNYQRSESNECQQKDDLPVDRERIRDRLSNSEWPTTHLLQFAIQQGPQHDRRSLGAQRTKLCREVLPSITLR